ncbi:MAG TPA: ABC transporter ATP-binding protein [Gammaproteobacteria bacterium]|nr:ABC transporter ATP-binding protein [Gammaproteobacteria bacterium]
MSQDRSVIARLEGVSKRYGSVQALDGLDLEVRRGEVLAVLGPNGAGKTTSIALMLGLVEPDAGRVSLFDMAPTARLVRQRCGVMLQVSRLPEPITVREHITLFSSYYPKPLPVAESLELAGLTEVADRRYGKLSGGQQQRLKFALALCGDPEVLFLDEPTVALDVEARRLMWDVIRARVARGTSVLLTTHYLEEADALADRIVVVGKGRLVVAGTPAEIKAGSAGRRIRCVTRISAESVAQLPDVKEVARHGAALEILAARAEPVLREMFLQDPELSDLEVTGAGLEQAFLALTRQPQQEAA